MAKILNVNVENSAISTSHALISDTIRMAFFQGDSALFDVLDYDNDCTFLEPSLYCYFLSDIKKKDKIPLLQSILGYITAIERGTVIPVKADCFGMVNLPNLGYLTVKPYEMVAIETDKLTDLIPNRLLKIPKSDFACIRLTYWLVQRVSAFMNQ